MGIYISSGCLGRNKSAREVVTNLLDRGVDSIEMSSSHFHEEGVIEFLRGIGASFLIHSYFPPPIDPFVFNLSSPDEATRRRSVQFAREAISACVELGCDIYTIHGGYLSDPSLDFGFKESKIISQREGLRLFFRSLEQVCRCARDAGVAVAVENNPCMPELQGKLLFCDASDFEKMFAEPAFHDVSVLLDLGHLKVSGQVMGFDPDDFIEFVESKVTLLHVNDNDGVVDTHGTFTEHDWCISAILSHGLENRNMVVEVLSDSLDEVLRCRDILLGVSRER